MGEWISHLFDDLTNPHAELLAHADM